MADKVVRLDRQLKYQGTILKIYEDTVLANGHEAHWDFIHHDGAAAVVPVADDGRILMVRQYRNALDRETLEIPAGKLEQGEDPLACAARELSEETGYTAGRFISLGTLLPSPGYCAETLHIFLALELTPGKAHLDEGEFLAVEYYPLKKLHEMTMTGELVDAKTVLAVLKAEICLGELK